MADDLRQFLGIPLLGKILRLVDINEAWVIEKLLPPMGRVMLTASAKVGKSLLATQLAHCLAVGDDFLGFRNQVGPMRVHYLDWEMGPVFMQRRLQTMSGLYPRADDNIFITMFPRGAVEDAMRTVRDVKLFIIDPISALHIEDENDNAKVRKKLDDIATVAREEYGAAVLVVHHMRKQGREGDGNNGNWYGGLAEARGAGAFFDWVDGGMALRELDRTERTFELRFGTRGAETPDPMVLVRDPKTLTYSPKYATMAGADEELGPEAFKLVFDALFEQMTVELHRVPTQAELVRRLIAELGKDRRWVYGRLKSIGIQQEE